jgi:hypothetical protein
VALIVGVLVVSDMLTWMHARSFDGSTRARVRLMGFYGQLCSCPTVVVPEAIAIPPLWLDPANAQRAPVSHRARDELQIQWLLPCGAKGLADGFSYGVPQ